MAEPQRSDSAPDIAAQEAKRLQLDRDRRAAFQAPLVQPAGRTDAAAEGEDPERRERRQAAALDRERGAAVRQADAKPVLPVGGLAGSMVDQKIQSAIGGLIKGSWGALLLTFGHSIFLIDILFISRKTGIPLILRYVPEVGGEWIPKEFANLLPKFLPRKLAEICAMGVITLFVLMMDIIVLGALALLVGLLMDAAGAIS